MATVDSTREALYDAIEDAAKHLKEEVGPSQAAPALRELAWAWRALVGGTQPGVSVIEK
ncbi:hypothetical protein [Leifsonia sp. P73]|uniref:hypothetical protein n=1 Tax=Leifsonia sp. P73 TaxID=3423959 RepID=UPI003DA420CD